MKTFEERYTAWVDGRMSEAEQAAFERELESQPGTQWAADRQDARRLGELLRTHGRAPTMTSEDFFSHQLLERIAAEERVPERRSTERRFFWPLSQLAWAGACCVLISFALYQAFVPATASRRAAVVAQQSQAPLLETPYAATILEAKAPDPGIYATPVNSDKDGVTVLWLDGLDYLPASYQLQ